MSKSENISSLHSVSKKILSSASNGDAVGLEQSDINLARFVGSCGDAVSDCGGGVLLLLLLKGDALFGVLVSDELLLEAEAVLELEP